MVSANGYYMVFYYNSNVKWINHELDLKLRQDDDVVKFLSMNLEENTEDLAKCERISLCEQDNRNIDALDVLLGLTSYYKKEVI